MQRSPALPIFLFSAALVLALGLWLNQALLPQLREQNAQLADLNRRVERVQNELSLLHFSAKIEGEPLERVLEHLEFWAQQRDEKRPSVIDEDIYAEKIERGKKALQRLGSSVFDRVWLEFKLPDNREKHGYRYVLLGVLRDIDSKRAMQAYAEILRDQSLDSRFRDLAARTMVEIDANVAGQMLYRELLTPPGARTPSRIGAARTTPGYDNLLRHYMSTPHANKRDLLESILRTKGHGIHIYNTAVQDLRGLGGGNTEAGRNTIANLKRLFVEGAPNPAAGDTMNPLFRRRCVEAVAELGGASACSWLREQLKVVPSGDLFMIDVLTKLIRKHCP